MKNKTYLIFRHEFLHMIKRKGFIIMTLLIPLLILLFIGITKLVLKTTQGKTIETIHMGYVDETGIFGQDTSLAFIDIVYYETIDKATHALTESEISEYFVIPADYVSTGIIKRYTLEKELETPLYTSTTIKRFLTANLLKGKVPSEIIHIAEVPVKIEVTRLDKTGNLATEQTGFGNLIVPGLFALLLGLALQIISGYLLEGLGKEKESRLIEILVSSVSIRQLLTGKVSGIGAAGLIQVLVWLISMPLLVNLTQNVIPGVIGNLNVPPNFIALGTVYFILGYLLFAVLSIGVGAISPNAHDAQSLALIYTLFSFTPLWFSFLTINFPESPVVMFLMLFPVTAPVETILKLGVADIPLWQIIVNITVLIISITGILYISIKVFRVYLLKHGKRPGIQTIIRSVKNA